MFKGCLFPKLVDNGGANKTALDAYDIEAETAAEARQRKCLNNIVDPRITGPGRGQVNL